MRTLLLDADIIAYEASAANQKTWQWDEETTSTAADFKAAKRQARDTIDQLMAKLDGDALVICLSDDFNNFRKELYPAYKSNRSGVERPIHLYDMKAWLAERYPTQTRPRLEADDVMGILATEPVSGEDRIMVSADKDMQTIPALLYRPQYGEVRAVSLEEADRYHLTQTLTGDATDGYPGCPGAGPAMAEKLLGEGLKLVPIHREITRGKNKGEIRTTWEYEASASAWESVVSAYTRFGLTERDALVQARLARILRHGEWDRRPLLWTPPARA